MGNAPNTVAFDGANIWVTNTFDNTVTELLASTGATVGTRAEIRAPIRRVAEENPTWGAPKIHCELLKLGLAVSERTVARYLPRVGRHGDPGKRWLPFLANHREMIAAL